MPRSKPPVPKWGDPAEAALKEFVEQYEKRLREITSSVARHARIEVVAARHVEEAFDVIDRYGSRQAPVWKTKLPAILGFGASFCLGIALNSPTLLPLFFADSLAVGIYMPIMVAIFALASGGLMLASWFCKAG